MVPRRALVLFILSFLPVAANALNLDAIQADVDAIRRELPIRADASTEVVGVLFDREALTLIFIEIVDLRVDPGQLLSTMKAIKVPHICEEYRPLIAQGLSLAYFMKARDGREIGILRAGPTECGM